MFNRVSILDLCISRGRDHTEQCAIFVQTLQAKLFDLFAPLEPLTDIRILRITPILQLLVVCLAQNFKCLYVPVGQLSNRVIVSRWKTSYGANLATPFPLQWFGEVAIIKAIVYVIVKRNKGTLASSPDFYLG